MRPRFEVLLPYLKGTLGALAVFAVAGCLVVLWHLWLDHQSLHQSFGALNKLIVLHPEWFK